MEKINVAELLKDCPKGMELDCTIWDSEAKVFLEGVLDDDFTYSIEVTVKYNNIEYPTSFTKYGAFNDLPYCKCVIFPKGKTTWEGFQRPFRDGDIVAYDNPHRENLQVFIFKNKKENNTLSSCSLMLDGDELDLEEGMYYITRLATEEEKQKLFKAIEKSGYKWNEETKTLEKLPKFKVGDRIQEHKAKDRKDNIYTITKIDDARYHIKGCPYRYTLPIAIQDRYVLTPAKFDINTLKPFDKVLVRDEDIQEWCISFFSHCNGLEIYKYSCINGSGYAYCIPYENNEHLLGTTNDCDDYFKVWEK